MASYKSDAIDLMANLIDKETAQITPAGEQLNIDDKAVEDVKNEVDVKVDVAADDSTLPDNETPAEQ